MKKRVSIVLILIMILNLFLGYPMVFKDKISFALSEVDETAAKLSETKCNVR